MKNCTITGEIIDSGFVICNEDLIFKRESDLIDYLHDILLMEPECEGMNDEELKDYAFKNGIYYWTEFDDEEDHEEDYYGSEGNLFEFETE